MSRKSFLSMVSLAVIATFILSSVTPSYALRPKSAAKDIERSAEMFGYGFNSDAGIVLAHDKVFKIKAAIAFTEGRAVQVFGGNIKKNYVGDVAKEYLQKSGELGIAQAELEKRLSKASAFLNTVFSTGFVNFMIDEIAKIDESKVAKESAKAFLSEIKRIAAIEDSTEKEKAARKALVNDTRFITFIGGEKGLDPYLFSVGNVLSNEHRALVAHIGTYAYEGSEGIAGGPRTIYTTLGRILGFEGRGSEGIHAFQDMMLHEFTDRAYGKHVEPPSEVRASLNKINADIDEEYNYTVLEVNNEITEEGPVVIKTPKITVTKYRRPNDLGKKDTFAIYGSSKVHPDILKGSGQKVTITIAKADVGSIGGHGTAPGIMREAVAEVWAKAAEQGLILDFFITAVGDDISVTVTHAKGKDNKQIHELIWNGFVNAAVIAKDNGWYAAGQDLLADAFSGNVRGAGPSVAEMDIKERGSEVVIFAQADKTAPGAFNKGLWEILFGTSTTWRSLGKGQSQKIKVGKLDFDYNNHKGRHIWFNKADYDHAAWYGGYPDRFTYDNFMLEDGTEMGAVTAQRLGIIAGEYVGKDDPMFMIRSQSEFPAVGEITSPFLKGEYVVPGWMRGSNKGPFFPVSLQDANIGIYDGPPLISMFSFNVTNGRLTGFYDLFAANPAIRHIQDKRAARAVTMLEQGFDEMSLRLAEVETAYQGGLKKTEDSLKDRWEVYTDEKKSSSTLAAVAEQEKTDEVWRKAGEKVTGDKAKAVRDNVLAQTWGKLKEIAQNFSGDISHAISDEVRNINVKKGEKGYAILINHDSLLKKSPDGIMALQNLVTSQLGNKGNIKFVLHVDRDDIKPADVNKIVDQDLARINDINGGYTGISRDMFAAIVVGTDPSGVAKQVQDKVGTAVYQVIGSESYVAKFKDANIGTVRIVLDEAGEGQKALASKALKLAVEAVPNNGNLSEEKLAALDALFVKDDAGDFHVKPANVSETIEAQADTYQKSVEAEVRV